MTPTPTDTPNQRPAFRNHGRFPLTDYSFQATPETRARPVGLAEKPSAEVTPFHKISHQVFGAEIARETKIEIALFVAISAVAAWPMAATLHQLLRWMI